eukprot:TRINITY_DN6942_c0_g3_i1.p1 TRINITY_DN6942_c0_g3~~TRINITY_DN6942_c0_g3_i1.p1  ORF type:complete len:128 (-),score=10.52 TRINITY_DN6942_c0_g3_i1:110-493(-)
MPNRCVSCTKIFMFIIVAILSLVSTALSFLDLSLTPTSCDFNSVNVAQKNNAVSFCISSVDLARITGYNVTGQWSQFCCNEDNSKTAVVGTVMVSLAVLVASIVQSVVECIEIFQDDNENDQKYVAN